MDEICITIETRQDGFEVYSEILTREDVERMYVSCDSDSDYFIRNGMENAIRKWYQERVEYDKLYKNRKEPHYDDNN